MTSVNAAAAAPEPYDERAALAADQAMVAAEKAGRRLAWWLDRMPARYADRPGHVFEADPRVAEWTRKLAAGVRGMPTLWMAGGVGTGKTEHVWRGVGEAAIAAGWLGSVEIITGAQFFEVCAPPVDYGRLGELGRAGLLVLDDVDSAGVTDWVRQFLYQVTHERWERLRPVVITSNAGNLTDMLGARVASRLQPVLRVPFAGPDHRRDGGQA